MDELNRTLRGFTPHRREGNSGKKEAPNHAVVRVANLQSSRKSSSDIHSPVPMIKLEEKVEK